MLVLDTCCVMPIWTCQFKFSYYICPLFIPVLRSPVQLSDFTIGEFQIRHLLWGMKTSSSRYLNKLFRGIPFSQEGKYLNISKYHSRKESCLPFSLVFLGFQEGLSTDALPVEGKNCPIKAGYIDESNGTYWE